jgi:hypothetical protein
MKRSVRIHGKRKIFERDKNSDRKMFATGKCLICYNLLLKRFYVTPTILVLSGNENLRILFPRKLCDSISTLEKPIEDETPISSHGFDTV